MFAVVFEPTLQILPFGDVVICFGQRRSAHQTQRMRHKELFGAEQLKGRRLRQRLKSNVVSVCPRESIFSDTPALSPVFEFIVKHFISAES
jgi:hypothetical protein